MEEIVIKEIAIKEHLADIARLMKGLQESEISYFNKSAPWDEIEKSYLQHLISIQEENDGTCLFAYNAKVVIGFIFGYAEEPDESRIEIYTGKELYVSDGYVLPEFRKQGIYKKMNEQLEQKYIQQGVKRITRFTLVNNIPMQNFLNSSGYKPTRMLFEKWL